MEKKASVYKRFIFPGIVFQSMVISGGYGTGRELAEFFMQNGSRGGFLAMCLISAPIWGLICALTFDFAHKHRTYEYKGMFSRLLGKWYIAYEVVYIVSLLFTLSVIASAAGEMGRALLGTSYKVGVLFVMGAICLFVLLGEKTILRVLSFLAFTLYAVYLVFFVVCFNRYGGPIMLNISHGEIASGWILGGIKYAFCNIGVVPACLFALKYAQTRKQAIAAGVIAAVIGILPAIFLYSAMLGFYPYIVNQALPIDYIFSVLGIPWLRYAFQLVLLGTLIDTGIGLIFAVTERFTAPYKRKGTEAPRALAPLISVGLILCGCVLSTLGLKTLVSEGYGTVSWCLLVVYAVPLVYNKLSPMLRRLKKKGKQSCGPCAAVPRAGWRLR